MSGPEDLEMIETTPVAVVLVNGDDSREGLIGANIATRSRNGQEDT